MKEQLQPHELCAYLPYRVEIIRNVNIQGARTLITELGLSNCESFINGTMPGKLLLRPLSDLSKEIEYKGARFVPLDMLEWFCVCDNDYCWVGEIKDDLASADEKLEVGPYHLVKKLHEWHFDTFNLIGRGLAERKGEQ